MRNIQWEEHCEYEANAEYDYHHELWASEIHSMRNEGLDDNFDNEDQPSTLDIRNLL